MCKGLLLKFLFNLMKMWEKEKGGLVFLTSMVAFSSKGPQGYRAGEGTNLQ